MVALVDGVPRTLNLASMLTAYVEHQVEVITRRSEFRLRKAHDRAHIVEGLLKALDMIDAIIALIRASDDRGAAREGLMAAPFEFSDVQAEHILDMTLGRLTRLGRHELEDEMAQLRETIAELEAILADDGKLRGVIKSELAEIRAEHATPRIARITFDPGDMDIEDLIDDEDLLVIMTGRLRQDGRCRRVPHAGPGWPWRRRGASSRTRTTSRASSTRPRTPTCCSSRTAAASTGCKAHEIPMKDRTAQGTAIVNLLPLAARRAHPGDHRHARLRDEPLPVLRHQARPGQEDVVHRVRLVAP